VTTSGRAVLWRKRHNIHARSIFVGVALVLTEFHGARAVEFEAPAHVHHWTTQNDEFDGHGMSFIEDIDEIQFAGHYKNGPLCFHWLMYLSGQWGNLEFYFDSFFGPKIIGELPHSVAGDLVVGSNQHHAEKQFDYDRFCERLSGIRDIEPYGEAFRCAYGQPGFRVRWNREMCTNLSPINAEGINVGLSGV
jgi:hypothetical protein